MILRREPHWGAMAFTIGIAALVMTVMATGGLRLLGGPIHVPPVPTPIGTASPRPAPSVPAIAAPRPEELGARLLALTASPVLHVGQVATVTLLFENTGRATWIRGTAAEARLGLIGEDRVPFDLGMAVEWPHPTRPAVQDERSVPAGGSAQFAFRIKGTVPGEYLLRLAPVVDGVAWMGGDGVLIDVTVRE